MSDPVPSSTVLTYPRIEDPFLGFNELKCEWIGEKSWTYRTTLPSMGSRKKGRKTTLALDGLDTFAHVKLNGKTILRSDNMFIPYWIDVTDSLTEGEENMLEIDFAPALVEARKIQDKYPEHKWVGFNGDMARLAARKAQYHLLVGSPFNLWDEMLTESAAPGTGDRIC